MVQILHNKYEQLLRLLYVRFVTPKNNSVILVEFPKSGGTWLGQLISSYLEIPFPRNQIPSLTRSLFHGHYLPSKRLLKNDKILYLVRDGRDVMISMYFHNLVWNDKNKLHPKDVHYHRSKVPFDDFHNVSSNIGAFMEYAFTHQPSKWRHFTFMGNWTSYNREWLGAMETSKHVCLTKYEDLLGDTFMTVKRILQEFFDLEVDDQKLTGIVNKYSFENQALREKGQENSSSFLRKGVQGDWKNHFSEKDKDLFKKYAGQTLIELGYEENFNW